MITLQAAADPIPGIVRGFGAKGLQPVSLPDLLCSGGLTT
jgi:hypothetical protein